MSGCFSDSSNAFGNNAFGNVAATLFVVNILCGGYTSRWIYFVVDIVANVGHEIFEGELESKMASFLCCVYVLQVPTPKVKLQRRETPNP